MSTTNTRNTCRFLAGALFTTWVAISANAQTPDALPKFSPDLPTKITTSDTVETRIGTLRYQDGMPDAATVQLAYDQLDFNRGTDTFFKGMSATSIYALSRGVEEAGINPNQGIGIYFNQEGAQRKSALEIPSSWR